MLTSINLSITAGNGGNGAVSFRRERYEPRGGPDGGDGGTGGEVILQADSGMWVLDTLRRRKVVRAAPGGNGGRAKRHGRNGGDVIIAVPVGTQVWLLGDEERLVADLTVPGAQVVVVRGGQGGKGNTRFKSAVRRAPRIAEKGQPGESIKVRLELKLLAEVGLVGLPNAG